MDKHLHSRFDVMEHGDRVAKAAGFICTDFELAELTRYHSRHLCELDYCRNSEGEPAIDGGTPCRDIIVRRINTIAEIIGRNVVDDIGEQTRAEFGRQMGAQFDRNITAIAVDKVQDYRRRCLGE